MKKRILISPKHDWVQKCKGIINFDQFDIDYREIEKVNNLYKYDAIIPLYEKDSRYLNKKKNSFKNQKFLIPSNEVIAICEDKKRFYDVLESHGLGKYTPKIDPSLSPPYILKKKITEWGKDTFIINNVQEEQDYQEELQSPDFFKQEYIKGKEEITCHFLIVDGIIQYAYTLSFLFEHAIYVKGLPMPSFGNAVITEVESTHLPLFQNILLAIGYEGVGCFDYKIKDGEPLIFEINPRVGGSLPLDVNRFLGLYCEIMKPSKSTNFFRNLFRFS